MAKPSSSKTSTSSKKTASGSEKTHSDAATQPGPRADTQSDVQSDKSSDKTPAAEKSEGKTCSDDRDLVLTHHEAEAGSPPDGAACGEEDPGSGLEFLVSRQKDR